MTGKQLYNSIKNSEISIRTLDSEQLSLLFEHLCNLLEQGESVDENILSDCESLLSLPDIPSAEEVMENTYKRFYRPKISGRGILRRALASAITAILAAALCFGTVYAFGVDIVGEIQTMLNADYTVVYENHNSEKPSALKKKYSMKYLFEKEFSGYIYPSYYPEGAVPVKVISNPSADGRIYTILIAPSKGENWQVFARPAEESYLPMGYKFQASYGAVTLDFVYTVSHGSEGITGYKLYTVYDGIQYSFYLYTSEWDEVKTILNNLIIP